jgi:hypothetical protein
MGVPSDRPEQREEERLSILGELRGEVMIFQPLAIHEISRDGVKIETGFPLHVDTLHQFRLTLGTRSVVLNGRVVHCTVSDVDQDVVVYRSGVQFVEPADRTHAVIDEFIEALKQTRRAQS